MTALVRCDRCSETTDRWMHVDIERLMGGYCVNQVGDPRERDLCPPCWDEWNAAFRTDTTPIQ